MRRLLYFIIILCLTGPSQDAWGNEIPDEPIDLGRPKRRYPKGVTIVARILFAWLVFSLLFAAFSGCASRSQVAGMYGGSPNNIPYDAKDKEVHRAALKPPMASNAVEVNYPDSTVVVMTQPSSTVLVPEMTETYAVNRYVDHKNKAMMHHEHLVTQIIQPARWNLRPVSASNKMSPPISNYQSSSANELSSTELAQVLYVRLETMDEVQSQQKVLLEDMKSVHASNLAFIHLLQEASGEPNNESDPQSFEVLEVQSSEVLNDLVES